MIAEELVSEPVEDLGVVAALERADLVAKRQRCFDRDPPPRLATALMRCILAYEQQCCALGGLTGGGRRTLAAIASGRRVADAVPQSTAVGTELVREWNGRLYRAQVVGGGYEMDGIRYRSLSAVAKKIIDGAKGDQSGWRLPAKRLESDLAAAIQMHLETAVQAGRITVDGAGDWQRLQASVAALGGNVLALIDRVDIAAASLNIRLDVSKLQNVLDVAVEQIAPDVLTTKIPTKLRRCGVEARFTIGDQHSDRDDTLITNIAKADAWRREIIAGKSLAETASAEGRSTTYIAQMIAFGFLAPKIVMQCLAGRQPSGLTTNRLRRLDLPLDWAEQQRQIARL